MDELLPCEMCNAMVPFSSYNDHVARCLRSTRIIGFLRRQIEENSTDSEEESNHAHENEIADMSRHFTRNAQVSRMSLHDFISNHFNGVSSPPSRNIVWFNIGAGGSRAGAGGVPTYESNLRLGERLGNVEVGLTEDQIGEISYSSTDTDELVVDKDDVCPICQENIVALTKENKAACILACGHIYCEPCIKHWLSSHKKCPVCMVDLEDAYCWGR
jgi:hypothetical protein